jgi:glutathione S-transferase
MENFVAACLRARKALLEGDQGSAAQAVGSSVKLYFSPMMHQIKADQVLKALRLGGVEFEEVLLLSPQQWGEHQGKVAPGHEFPLLEVDGAQIYDLTVMLQTVARLSSTLMASHTLDVDNTIHLIREKTTFLWASLGVQFAPDSFGHEESFKGSAAQTAAVQRMRDDWLNNHAKALFNVVVGKLEANGAQGCLCSATPTIADAVLVSLLQNIPQTFPPLSREHYAKIEPKIVAYLERMEQIPALAPSKK